MKTVLFKRGARNLGLVAVAVLPMLAFADTAQAQPDVTEVTAYILAGIATLTAIYNAELIVQGVVAVFRKVRSAIR